MNDAGSPALELLPIDISPYRTGNTGIDYVHRFASGQPGPVIMVNAITHGNELCGAYAVDFLFRKNLRPRRGELLLSFTNVAAYLSFQAHNPTASRFIDEDINRVWSDNILDGPRQSVEISRAREMRPILQQVDFLLDIHSMQLPSPALMLSGTAAKGAALAHRVGVPRDIVADPGHQAGPRMRDYGDFARSDNPKTALLIECGQHWQKASADLAIEASLRFLLAVDAIDEDDVRPYLSDAAPDPQRLIEVSEAVTIDTDDFRFADTYYGMEIIPTAGTLLGTDGDREVRTPYDNCVLIMPSRRLVKGQTAVRLGRLVDG